MFLLLFQKGKRRFFDSKITKLKKSKFWYFSKGAGGLVHWSKVEIFSTFLFLAKSASKMYLTIIILERKKRSF